MSQKQNGLFSVIHRFGGQTGLVVEDKNDAVFPWNVLGSDNNEFVPVDARIESDLPDFPARYVAADGGAMQHARQNHVVNIASRTGDFVPALFAGYG